MIQLAQFGLGPIGLETIKLAATKPWARIIGAVDIDPDKIGRSLGELTGLPALNHARVFNSYDSLAAVARPDVVLHTTVSRFRAAYPQLEQLARAGVSVVSSCEELLFPQLREPVLAGQLDALAQSTGARLVGTGVNPGYVMDLLAVTLTGVYRHVERIEVNRVVNASLRRLPLQKKIGSGLAPEEFRELFRAGKMGHVGLVESLALVAHCLAWPLGPVHETCDPVLAPRDLQTQFLHVPRGRTCGIHHRAEASTADGKTIVLDLVMALDAENPCDEIRVTGDPPIHAVLHGGVHGDHATVAALVNTAARIRDAAPGLRLMTDLSTARVS